MTSYEVVENLMRGKPSERVGFHEAIWEDTLERWITEGYPTKTVDGEEKPSDPADNLPYDMVGVGGWFDAMPLRHVSELLEETDEWAVRRNGAGAALKYWKNKSGTPEHIDFLMTSREVWDRDYRPHLLEIDRDRLKIDAARDGLAKRREEGRWAFYGHLFIWEMMRQSMGDVCMYESLVLDPDWIHDYNRVYTDFFQSYYKILFEEVDLPDGVWMYEDLGYRNGLFASPKTLDELILPYYKEMVDFFHSYDLPVILHSCGSITEGISMVVETGFDGLNPMEAKAGNDLFDFAEGLAVAGHVAALLVDEEVARGGGNRRG